MIRDAGLHYECAAINCVIDMIRLINNFQRHQITQHIEISIKLIEGEFPRIKQKNFREIYFDDYIGINAFYTLKT